MRKRFVHHTEDTPRALAAFAQSLPRPWLVAVVRLPMKAVVILLALLAAAKLGYQEYLFRSATRDAIIGAYREHAVQACQKDARSAALGSTPQAWANPQASSW